MYIETQSEFNIQKVWIEGHKIAVYSEELNHVSGPVSKDIYKLKRMQL